MYELIILLFLLALGYFFGRHAENRHYRSIRKREKRFMALPTVATRVPPRDQDYEQRLVSGGVVISVDYFKRFLAGLRNLFGGRVKSYESLLDRARREAILRMKEEAYRQGASYVFNLKIETSSISKGAKDTVGAVEVFAYGTAMIPPRSPD
ncbi:MAG: YbjQ family protein [Gammaproteobacteria bacterium]